MPKEIANKTKEEIHPIREFVASNGASYKCLPVQILQFKICSGTHCLSAIALATEGGDEVFWNTHKKFTYCKCKKIWIDGCEDYVRVGGKEGDHKVIKK